MIELTERQLLHAAEEGLPEAYYLFIYTPFCGTCAAARRMLDILEQMRPGLPLYSMNINFAPQLTRAWEISSVPCLLRIQGSTPNDRLYAMQSIDHIFRFIVPE